MSLADPPIEDPGPQVEGPRRGSVATRDDADRVPIAGHILAVVSGGFLLMVLLHLLGQDGFSAKLFLYGACLLLILGIQNLLVPRGARLSAPVRLATSATMAACAIIPTYWAGEAWLGTWVFLGATVMLLQPRAGPIAAIAIGVGGAAVGSRTEGLISGAYNGLGIVGASLAFAGLTQMGNLIRSLGRTRAALAATVVLDERQRFQRQLRQTLARALDVITVRATRAEVFLGENDRNRAEAELAQLRATTQGALSEVRAIARTYPAADPEPISRGLPAGASDGVGRWRRPTLSFAVLFAVLGMRATDCLLGGLLSPPESTSTIRALLVTAVFAIQIVMFSGPITFPQPWRIAAWLVQGGLAAGSVLLTARHTPVPSAVGFFAGSALLLLPRAAGITVALGAIAANGVWLGSTASAADLVYPYATSVNTALIVFGLTTLHKSATKLREAEAQLRARAATQERARLARDLHDFLGLTLSGIALKSQLAAKIVATDPGGARTEVLEILPVAERARTEIAWVASSSADITVEEELAAALANLAAAGVTASVERIGPQPPLSHVFPLATALREAITNALRHADPSVCRIRIEVTERASTLRVVNDGVDGPPPPGHRPGTGLTNVTRRVTDNGGSVTSTPDGETFTFEVTLPVRAGDAGQLRKSRLPS